MGNFRKKEKNLAGQRKDASEAHRAAEGRSQVLGDQQESAQVHRQLIAVANWTTHLLRVLFVGHELPDPAGLRSADQNNTDFTKGLDDV